MDQVRVLYIDDDAGIGRLVERALAPHGIGIRHVSSGDEGLALLASEKFDAIALDHNLTNETGLDVLAKIQRRDPNNPDLPTPAGYTLEQAYYIGKDDIRRAIVKTVRGHGA